MVKRLKSCNSCALPDKVQIILDNYSYVFNPSFLIHKKTSYLAIRVYDTQEQSILALVFVWKDNNSIEQIDLSEYFRQKLGYSKVADPKLFIMNGEVCGSFNTGHATNKPNELVLFKLDKTIIKEYFVCKYNARMKTEKNWTFYSQNDALFALYSLTPLTILKAETIEDNAITFKSFYSDETQNFKNYSIGSPLVKLNECYGFIAHKKYFRKRKRLYLGKACTFSVNGKPEVNIKKQIIIHSLNPCLVINLNLIKT